VAVHVIVDASGSMLEDDKHSVVEYILVGMKHVCGWERFNNTNYEIYEWKEKVESLGNLKNYKNFKFSGSSKIQGLQEFINTMDDRDVCIVISDGNFEMQDLSFFETLVKSRISISVGADCNDYNLKKISNNIVYKSIDYIEVMKMLG
jgi:hypothetical protein